MTTRLQKRRARIKAEYGFDFPDDFYEFWELATRLSPLDPLNALQEATGVTLVGPFEVLSGRFDGRVPKHSLLLHWRYYLDPPEFFTVLAGNSDGQHWGYVLDDPDGGQPAGVASYYARDAYEFSADGDNLFEAYRLHLEEHDRDCQDYRDDEPDEADYYDEVQGQIAKQRERLMKYATGNRKETGEDYIELYAGVSSRNDRIVAETWGGLGVVAAKKQYRKPSVKDKQLWKDMFKKRFAAGPIVEEARQALAKGHPATALKVGRDLWVACEGRNLELACDLMDEAYAALGREALRNVLRTHLAHRDLPSVDILDDETPV